MSTPAIIIIVFNCAALLQAGYLHGKPRTGTHDAGVTVFSLVLNTGILYWGGFFS